MAFGGYVAKSQDISKGSFNLLKPWSFSSAISFAARMLSASLPHQQKSTRIQRAFFLSGAMNFVAGLPVGFSVVRFSSEERKKEQAQQFEKITVIFALATLILGFLIPLIFTSASLTAGLLFKSWFVTQVGLVAGVAAGSLATSISMYCIKKFTARL